MPSSPDGRALAHISLSVLVLSAQTWTEMSLQVKGFRYLNLNEAREVVNLPPRGHLYFFSIQHMLNSTHTQKD